MKETTKNMLLIICLWIILAFFYCFLILFQQNKIFLDNADFYKSELEKITLKLEQIDEVKQNTKTIAEQLKIDYIIINENE